MAKLFESIEVSINHVLVNSRSSANDYSYNAYFMTRMNKDEISLETTGSLDGYWSNNNLDTSGLINQVSQPVLVPDLDLRKTSSKTVKIDGKTYHRYFFVSKLHTGLADTMRPFPKNNIVNITLNRAIAEKSIVAEEIDENGKSKTLYPDKVFKITLKFDYIKITSRFITLHCIKTTLHYITLH